MTAPQDAPAGTVLGEEARRAVAADLARFIQVRENVDLATTWVMRSLSAHVAALLSSACEEGAAAERERIAREHCEDAHRQVRVNWHIDPEYERGRLHALDDLYRALQGGPS